MYRPTVLCAEHNALCQFAVQTITNNSVVYQNSTAALAWEDLQFKVTSRHTVIRIHLISLSIHILVILPSHFRSMEQMLMLMFSYDKLKFWNTSCDIVYDC